MMKPLSPRKRFFYLVVLTMLFFVSVPVALLYSSGYRYKQGFGLVKTGGIYLSVPYDDATISLNGEVIGTTRFLNKSFYIDDLAPSSYAVHVEQEGSRPWYRTLVVEPQLVTRAEVLLIPEAFETVRLTRGGQTSTSTRALSADLYDSHLAAFKTPATSTTSSGRGVALEVAIENGDAYVHWGESEREPQDNFCIRPSNCVESFLIEDSKETAVSVSLFGGGVVYATRQGGVFFSEIDIRRTPISAALYPRWGADARVIDDELIVKDGNALYAIEGF